MTRHISSGNCSSHIVSNGLKEILIQTMETINTQKNNVTYVNILRSDVLISKNEIQYRILIGFLLINQKILVNRVPIY